ncbi:MAG: CoA transferase, partial [Gammaproteobacteria bacterium]|nr:CoA transferase [Gammaproteobacteria bacterium]
ADLPERRQALAVSNALGMQYETADSRWLQLTLLNEDREWPRLLAALKAEHLADDPRFCTTADRREHAPALHGLLVEAFQRFSAQQAKTMLEAAGIPAAMLTAIDDLPEDAQALAADIVTAVAEPRPGGWAQTVNSPIWIAGFPKQPASYAPDLGEHSDEILQELGIDGERLARLREQGVIR